MNSNTTTQAKAQDHHGSIAELRDMQRAIEASRDEKSTSQTLLTTFGTNGVMLGGALVFALVCIIVELVTGHGTTQQFMESANNNELKTVGLIQVAMMIGVLCATLYFFVFRAAKRSNRDFNSYVARNFSYLKNLSFLSDLLVKFVVFSAIVIAGKPEWVAPCFMLFIGDYLIQGRFFTISLNLSLILGVISILGAAVMVWLGSTLLLWPLLTFAIATGLSFAQLIAIRKHA